MGASTRFTDLHQGNPSIAEKKQLTCQWNDAALHSVFFRGLSDQLKDELTSREEPKTFDLFSLAIRIDNRLRERLWGKRGHSHYFPSAFIIFHLIPDV